MLPLIKDTLLNLKPTGEDGFEGLVGEIILGITGIPSRLAKSGTQFGIDGGSVFPADAICFEAKLYNTKLKKSDVVTKVAELGMNKEAADILWVLGATTPISTQDASLLSDRGALDGISVLILDWKDDGLSNLAVSLVMAQEKIVSFFVRVQNLDAHQTIDLEKALRWVASHSDYNSHSEKLRSEFNAVELATENAKKANKKWINKVFSEKNTARNVLGQPVAPLNNSGAILPRSCIITNIEHEISNNRKTIFLLGEEGSGKSWIAASLLGRFSGLSIFISAEHLDGTQPTQENLKDLLTATLARQCGQSQQDKTVYKRWGKRLEGWERNSNPSRLLVVLDGLNQRPLFEWHKIINVLQDYLHSIDGHLVVTTRPQLFNKKVKQGLVEDSWQQLINNWSNEERDQLLEANGISSSALDPVTANSLLNPRLLGIALEVLPLDNQQAWEGLTTDRLLFEHLRLSQRDNLEPESPDELARRISNDASKALEKITNIPISNILVFQSETEYVAEGRFYENIKGPGRHYKLRDEGLTLAFGYALVDLIWDANYNGEDLEEALAKLIEPISALDRTTEVYLAGLTVCAKDEERFTDSIFITLIKGFTGLQNLDPKWYLSFREICYERFDSFLVSLENSFLSTSNKVNLDWLKEVAIDAKNDTEKWDALSASIKQWLSYYSKKPEHSLIGFPQSQSDEQNEKIKAKESKIKKAIEDLSPFELEIFSEMEEKNGNLDQLALLAMELLVGKSLSQFTRSFIRWGLSSGINSGYWRASSEFLYLTNFNRVDWKEMCSTFRLNIQPLDRTDTSRGGQWTYVRMLYATGTHEDAMNADATADRLRKGEKFGGNRLVEKYCATDPCDPNSLKPDNIEETAQLFKEIKVDQLYSGDFLEATDDGHLLKTTLLGVARFYPSIATSKHRELLSTWSTRTGKSLAQLSLNGDWLMPLIDSVLAKDLFIELVNGENFKTVSDDYRLISLKVLCFISPYLEAEQQLDVMLLPDPETLGYLMDMTRNLKKFDTDVFSRLFSQICTINNDQAIISALGFLTFTDTQWNDITKKCVLQLMEHSVARVRACVFCAILNQDFSDGIEKLYHSAWDANVDSINTYEEFYGSRILINSVELGMATLPEIFERCSIKVLSSCLPAFSAEEQFIIIKAIDSSFDCLIEQAHNTEIPAFEVTFKENEYGGPPNISLDGFKNLHPKMHLLDSETHEEFIERQKLLNDTFEKFQAGLNKNIAILVLDQLKPSDVENIFRATPAIIKKWAERLEHADTPYLAVHLCYLVAIVISKESPKAAKDLFIKAKELDSFVTINYKNGLTLERKAIWSSSLDDVLEEFRRSRLDNMTSDLEIAMEVLAAETCGRGDFIINYVNDGIGQEHPYSQARAIMVAGYSNQTEYFSPLLNDAAQKKGLIGDTGRVSLETHKRCCWAKHWANEMIRAQTVEEFWCASLLLAKVVDRRLELFLDSQSDYGFYWPQYHKAISRQILARIKKWENKRKETFLGIKSINKVFLDTV